MTDDPHPIHSTCNRLRPALLQLSRNGKNAEEKMTKSIRSYPKNERDNIINKRLANHSGGLGYWAAVDAIEAIKKAKIKESKEK